MALQTIQVFQIMDSALKIDGFCIKNRWTLYKKTTTMNLSSRHRLRLSLILAPGLGVKIMKVIKKVSVGYSGLTLIGTWPDNQKLSSAIETR